MTRTLAHVPLFRSLRPDAIAQLDTRCTWRQVAAKQSLVEYDGLGTDVFFLTSGSLRVQISTSAERDIIFTDVKPGEFFGELAAIDGKARSAGVLAVTQATVACMPAAVFCEALRQHPEVAAQVMRLLVGRIRALTQRVHEFSAMHVKQRICAELLRRSRPVRNGSDQAIVSPPPTHAEIAARVSTRREMVARELKALERAGMLAKRKGAFVLNDVRGLMQLLQISGEQ